MHEHLSKRGKVAATFMAMLLVITFTAAFLPKATATPTITSVDPESGHVGDIVRVVGGIDTVNGSYAIFFDGNEVKNGTAVGTAVNDTFIVPHRPLGNYGVMLHDATTKNNYTFPISFAVETAYYVEAVAPPLAQQLQEGDPTQILVNLTGGEANTVYSANITVTDPSGAVYYNDTLQLTNTTNTGYGEGNITYPANFSLGANTDYVGVYLIAFNGTLATGNFTVGLTDSLEYERTKNEVMDVLIRGAGYEANETVIVNVAFAGESVGDYPKNITAGEDGVVTDSWTIPSNATLGIYTVTLTDATGMHVKPIPDIQNFTVTEVIVYLQTRNKYDKKPLAGVSVEAYLGETYVASGITNETGWIDLQVSHGSYTFKAFWKTVEVGSLNYNVLENVTLSPLECELAHLTITIKDEAGFPLPFINVTLTSNKTGALQFETNNTGTIRTNTFTNVNYTIDTRRYGHLFNTTRIENLTVTMWINVTCPTYTLFVHVVDSKELPLQNVQVEVYEWSSWLVTGPEATDDQGSLSLDLTFGRYKIRVYDYSAELGQTVIFNETVVDLIEDQFSFVVRCKIFNLNLSVVVIDYFGQSIPKALVKVEREFEQKYVNVANLTTTADGTAPLPKVGGNYRISVYVMNKLYETKTLHLDESKVIQFKIDKLVMVGGYLLEVTQLITYVSLGIMVAMFALALIYRRLRLRKVQEEK